ncbi:MAG TPA: TIGR00725 family protein [Longimicrobiales bacterium]|nr:TIGR00725 family protein [Longimicrobiales bacterium]
MREPPIRIAVCGASRPPEGLLAAANEVGRRVAEAGAVLLCGGLGGVMEAAARGADSAGGLTIGFLPGSSAADANPHIHIPLPTGLGEARNVLVVRTADAVIAVGGEWGTLSEVAFARKVGVPVVLLEPGRFADLGLEVADTAEESVRLALHHARRERMR